MSLSVVAPWYEVPLFEQLYFFMVDYSESLSLLFLKGALSEHKIDDSEYLWAQVKSLLPEDAFNLLKGHVDLGFYVPRAEAYRETARTYDGSNYRRLFAVGSDPHLSECPFLGSEVHKFEFDIAFNGVSNVYVYADLHDRKIGDFVLKLLEDGFAFVLRPLGQTEKFGINLRGFGIEMRPFKYSMEYGVKDEAASTKDEKTTSIDVEDETVKHVTENPKEYVNVSDVTHFGSRLARFLASKYDNKTNLLSVLRDVTGNYPLFMGEIAEAEPDRVATFDILERVDPQRSYSSINGRFVNLQNMDVFTLLDIIQQEKNFRTVLEGNFKIPNEYIEILASLGFRGEGGYVLDWESDSVVYLNDIEKDEDYATWDTSVISFVTARQIPQVRKNLLNLVIYGDFSTPGPLSHLISCGYLIDDGYPIRLGVVPAFAMNNKLSRKVAYAFHHLALRDQKAAIEFLQAVLRYCGIDPLTYALKPIEENHFVGAYEEITAKMKDVLPWSKLHYVYDQESEESKNIAKAHKSVQDMGITRPMLLLNGMEVAMNQGTERLMYDIQRTLQILQQSCRAMRLTSFTGVSALDLMARSLMVVPYYDREVLKEPVVGLGIFAKTLSQQLEFTDWIEQLEWNVTDEGRTSAFYILFSKNQTEIDTFMNFANGKHESSTVFAVNPAISARMVEVLGLNLSETTLIADGRVFKSVKDKQLRVIDKWLKHRIVDEINKSMNTIKYKRNLAVIYFSCIACDWRSMKIHRRFIDPDLWNLENPLVYNAHNDSVMHWDIVMNPFSRSFQRIAPIVNYMNEKGIVSVRMVAVPPLDMTEPVSTYYRMALEKDSADFTMLNDTTTYSSMPDMPDSWIFESMKAVFDLDNILLMEMTPSRHDGVYVLTGIKADGHCRVSAYEFAEGAELVLCDYRGVKQSDTIVMMANGYWQLAANPGQWKVDLGGRRSKMIYHMDTETLTVASFARVQRVLTASVNKGMEGLKVYNVSIQDTSNSTTVNVFSVASGHLYERLLKIMMLAVRRRSQYNVKFWILKNFLSPQFKATIPVMAKKYNFSYQLVAYKWPNWVNPQVEKQRIIWGNKILFLDVLFPLDLDRVVYIDADQVVRTDLIELMRMDFHGAPYAFTPFCDSRKETEPFRFWKHGYWLNHLNGKPYHISALFAIDLPRFRQMAAGDWLRHYYQVLSPDPGSLANLDQDLPNYAQFHIPIYSLPQNWLWCETWCSDDTMDQAKTIDLCNNPLTKAPKLFIAQTRIAEWPALDEEVKDISAGPDEYEKFFFPDK